MQERRYLVTFAIDRYVPPITEKQIPGRILESDMFGAADAIVILSMLYPEDGSFALLVDSLDGSDRQRRRHLPPFRKAMTSARESKTCFAVIPPEESELRIGLLAISEGFRVAMATPNAAYNDVTCWNYWRTRGTDVLEAALMQRPSQPWIERVKGIWLGRE